ncbi:MAG TPA: hypothetical protein VGM06_01400 [Polyangiaceae bacterium]|jgi:hypothetical protein
MAATLAKAQFDLLQSDFKTVQPGTSVPVQFNPDSLKVSLSNQIQQPSGAGDQRGPSAMQFVGAGTMKMTAQLWFDAAIAGVDDVRSMTKKIRNFITPQQPGQQGQGGGGQQQTSQSSSGGGQGQTQAQQFVPPFVSFSWGTFRFDGIMDSLEENLEFFSPDGKPIRASVSFSLIQQKIQFFPGEDRSPNNAGNKPYTGAPQGSTVQSMASSVGQGDNWQSIASANGIENPRQLSTGLLVDLSAGVSGGVGGSVTAGVTLGASGTGGVTAGASASASVGINVGFNIG